MWIVVLQKMALECVLDFFYFPIWWYSRGLYRMLLHCKDWLQTANLQFAPGLWLKNIFVPMFGQYDWQGRIVSFFIRFANVIGRAIALFIWTLLILAVFLVWLVIPFAITYLFFKALI